MFTGNFSKSTILLLLTLFLTSSRSYQLILI